MTEEQFDSIGVTLSLDNRGRMNAARVFIRGDKVIKTETLTISRGAAWALKEARASLERISTDWQRGLVALEQPERVKMIVEDR